jgi:uncharacterized membrane protein YeaQ/YmgE (transglycosylase-associated protein family)
MLSSLVYWILIGLVAGWLASKVMRDAGHGLLVDILIGMVGAIIGGWVFGLLGSFPFHGLVGSIVVAFVGAIILLWFVRMLKRA